MLSSPLTWAVPTSFANRPNPRNTHALLPSVPALRPMSWDGPRVQYLPCAPLHEPARRGGLAPPAPTLMGSDHLESSGHSDPVGADLTRALNPLAATLAENQLVNPTIATDPISHFRKSFPCRTSKTPPGVRRAPQPLPCPECNRRRLARRRRACPERSRRASPLSTLNYQLWTFLRPHSPLASSPAIFMSWPLRGHA